ncbi:MAG: diaminopimelate epimerase, partial [Ignavibacteriae bacterium]|nr:diaminopimelate epimerase [Ignavibacteriota bacterium]
GSQIRNSDFYNPSGTNVNVIKLKEDYVKIRTYERGVEAETFACGTGTVASAIISNLILNLNPPIKFLTKDNDILTVSFEKKNSEFVKINLTGPAKINYIGTYNFFNYEELNG